jgi:hypothetical protein
MRYVDVDVDVGEDHKRAAVAAVFGAFGRQDRRNQGVPWRRVCALERCRQPTRPR